MDKSWVHMSRLSDQYVDGVIRFLDFAFMKDSQGGEILCPCKKCKNFLWGNREFVYEHLVCNEFDSDYRQWIFHGEASSSSKVREDNLQDDIDLMLHEAYGMHGCFGEKSNVEELNETPSLEAFEFRKLVEDAQQDLYPGCKKFTKLSFLVRLINLKCLYKLSDASVTSILELFKEVLPEGETLPKDFSETKTIMKGLGLDYIKIDACPNNCILFWDKYAEATECHECGASRCKTRKNDKETKKGNNADANAKSLKKGNIPAKVLRYFPLKPRLQRLFMCSKIADSMRWHKEGCTEDGVLRHPANGQAWKSFDSLHPDFAADPRNVRLGLASDGFNPFKAMSTSYSIWPVILMVYNLPPWLGLKPSFFILSLLIPGDKSPGNDIDVFLQPLIKDLKELWEVGLETYDASMNQNFKMHAALLWTINDFPAYAMLSGWSTKGFLACPSCHYDTSNEQLEYSGKTSYVGHRKFLDSNHRWRRNKKIFNGKTEFRLKPVPLSGSVVLKKLGNFKNKFGKKLRKKRDKNNPWTKKSIFFELLYWEHNVLRHNLDVMHIEKNICDSLLGTLLDIEGKTKDHLKARLDLQKMGIREDLHPRQIGPNRILLPLACYSMTSEENAIFCKVLKGARFPDGFVSNISRRVQMDKLTILPLKSHDCHVILHILLPIAARRVSPKHVVKVLVGLSSFFVNLCSKTNRIEELEHLEKHIAMILCQLETIFPPSFFDIMVHLPIHLAQEVILGGPVQYRYMYPIERFLSRLGGYMWNKSHPEGSIAEGYLIEESLTFCSHYLHASVETRLNRPKRIHGDLDVNMKESSLFPYLGKHLGNSEMFVLNPSKLAQAHRYVLFNCPAISPYIKEHAELVKNQNYHGQKERWGQAQIHSHEFYEWFENRVVNEQVSKEIKSLGRGPNEVVRRFKGFDINGLRFRTKDHERDSLTQNSGVVMTALTESYSSAKDKNPVLGNVIYYGVVTDIFELDYYGDFHVVLFKCDWFQHMKDEFGFTVVNFSRKICKDDPFVLASQVEQAFYIEDPIDEGMCVAFKNVPRDFYHVCEERDKDILETFCYNEPTSFEVDDTINSVDGVSWSRNDVPGMTLNF